MLQGTNATTPMISSVYEVEEIESGELVSIPFIVYDPNDNQCDILLSITYKVDGEIKPYGEPLTRTVDQGLQTWSTRDVPVSDEVTFTISYTENDVTYSKSHTIKVKESEFKIEPISGPTLYLTANGRSNKDDNYNEWTYSYVDAAEQTHFIETTFNKFNWKSNGWLDDSLGDTCLRLSGGAQAVIQLAPFSQSNFNIANHGLTFEITFKVTDVNNRDTVIFDCYDDLNNIGIKATADTAIIKSSEEEISCNYKDNEVTRITFTIEKTGNQANGYESAKFLSVYMNGVLSGICSHKGNFNHNTFITLGDALAGCTVDIYNIRIYDTVLSHREVVNNYIADINDLNQKKLIFKDNDIYTKAGKLSYEEVKERIPTITFTGSMPTFKGEKKVVTMDFVNPFDHSRDFSAVYGGPIKVEIDVQGTSSQYYIRKNWKIKLEKKLKDANGDTVTDANGKTVYEFKNAAYEHMANELPAKVFCIKVDYAEATGTHNTQNANFVETLYTTTVPGQTDEEFGNERVRTTITGFPCVIYEKANSASTPVFSSKGNFNYDKDAEEAFGFTKELNEKYGVECWEFCNNDSGNCNFTQKIDTNANWLTNFEPRYTPYADEFETLDDLESKVNKGTTLTEQQSAQLTEYRQTIIAKFKQMHDWVCDTAGAVNADDEVVDNSKLLKFANEFTQYFDLEYSLIYYVYTFVALMTDQRAKNMFLTYWGKTNSNDGVWYPYFYDNDTSYGINNEGYLIFDYYHEDIDKVNDTEVYNGQYSTLWTNFRHAFASQIAAKYSTLRSDGKITYGKITNQFIKEGSAKWSASIYNEDAEYKYVTMARPENASSNVDLDPTDDVDETGKVITSNLYQVRGNGESHLKYFVQNRIKYCDSKWNAGTYPNDYVLMRLNTPQVTNKPSNTIIDSRTLNVRDNLSIYVVDDRSYKNLVLTETLYDSKDEATRTAISLAIDNYKVVNSDGDKVGKVYDEQGNELTLKVIDNKIVYNTRYSSVQVQVKRQADTEYSYIEELSIADLGYVTTTFVAPYTDTYTFSLLDMSGSNLEDVHYRIVEPSSENEGNQKITDTIKAVPPNPNITVTPFSNMYCGVKYKANGTLIQHRTEANEEQLFEPISSGGKFNDTETTIHGASELSSLGDLSALYCSVVDVSNATKLSTLTVGNSTPGYCNTMLREISFGANTLLRTVDLSNCERLNETIDLSRCPSIEHIYCLGTSIKGVDLPDAGYLKTLHLPNTITSLKITDHPELTNLKIGDNLDTSNIVELCLVGCKGLNSEQIFNECLKNNPCKLQYVRLTDIHWTDWTVEDLRKLYLPTEQGGYGLGALDDDGVRDTSFINISGTCVLNEDVSGEIMAELQSHFKFLDFIMAEGKFVHSVITFMDDTGENVLAKHYIKSSETENVTCPDPYYDGWEDEQGNKGKIELPVRESTPKYTYEWIGWNRNPGQIEIQNDALLNIAGNRTLYPAFTPHHRSYEVKFINGNEILYSIDIPYEDFVKYDYTKVSDDNKQYIDENGIPLNSLVGESSRTYYEFVRWYPEIPTEGYQVLQDTTFTAIFRVDPTKYHEVTLDELMYRVKETGVDEVNKTKDIYVYGYTNGSITDILEPVIRIPATYEQGDYELRIIELQPSSNTQGDIVTYNSEFKNVQVVALPDNIYDTDGQVQTPSYLTAIRYKAFYDVDTLYRVELGDSIEIIEGSAFADNNNLREVFYNVKDCECVCSVGGIYNLYPFNKMTQATITIGPDCEIIPTDMFRQVNLTTNNLLDLTTATALTKIDSRAFQKCNLKEIRFASNDHNVLTTIGDQAFEGNTFITEMVLPKGLTSIGKLGVGNFSNLTRVSIPNTVTNLNGAFEGDLKLFNFDIEEGSPFTYNTTNNENTINALVKGNTLVFGTKDTIIGKDTTNLSDGAFKSNTDLIKLHIPNNVNTLGQECFYGCSNLNEVSFDSNMNLVEISNSCFSRTGITAIEVPENVTLIRNLAFDLCTKLTHITLPTTLKSLEYRPFQACRALSKLEFKCASEPTVTTYENNYYMLDPGDVYNLREVRFGWNYNGINEVRKWGFDRNNTLNTTMYRIYNDVAYKDTYQQGGYTTEQITKEQAEDELSVLRNS